MLIPAPGLMKNLIRPASPAKPVMRAKKIIQLLGLTITFFCAPLMASEKAVLDCLVKPEMYVDLSSSVDAILEKILVDTGDHIKKGQPLVRLEASVEEARVNLARIQANSNNEIDNRRVQLQYAKRNSRRIKNLYARKSVSLYEKDKAETEVALAEIELDKAAEKKKIAQLNLALVKTELARRTIRSPIDGIVVDRYSMVGLPRVVGTNAAVRRGIAHDRRQGSSEPPPPSEEVLRTTNVSARCDCRNKRPLRVCQLPFRWPPRRPCRSLQSPAPHHRP